MKHIIKIWILIIFSLTFSVHAEKSPIPPEVKSEIGYLSIKEDISILPEFKRFMILPHVELLVLSEDNNAFHLIYISNLNSYGCKIPKYAKIWYYLGKWRVIILYLSEAP
jgi:hypothetical protein